MIHLLKFLAWSRKCAAKSSWNARLSRWIRRCVLAEVCLVLAACGGGSTGESSAASATNGTTNVLPQLSLSVPTYLSNGNAVLADTPTITVQIDGHPFVLLFDTGQTGITVSASALAAAGVSLPCFSSTYRIQYADGSSSTGCIASAQVSVGGVSPVTTMNIGVSDSASKVSGTVGDFGVGMGALTLGNWASPVLKTPDYFSASGYSGFLLDCEQASSIPSQPACTVTAGLQSPSTLSWLPVDSGTAPLLQATPVLVSYGLSGTPEATVFDSGSNAAAFGTTELASALGGGMASSTWWDANCQPFGAGNGDSSLASLRFSASSGSVNLGFVTSDECGASNNGGAIGNWLLHIDGVAAYSAIWAFPLMLGHVLWFQHEHVGWVQ